MFFSSLRRVPRAGAVAAAAAATAAAFVAYQPRIQAAESDHIYVINGFYMAMREKYTQPGGKIHYYLVEWDANKLSWEGFRNSVLGSTDPTIAADGSLRKAIFTDWKKMGLTSEPNVGDNGVHASASPFEALCERLNWVGAHRKLTPNRGAKLEEDAFGKAMLDCGIPKETILKWTKDPQVSFEGKKQSLFDLLEDLDYKECLTKAQSIAGVSGTIPDGKMQAFVFVKPHAVTDATLKVVRQKFDEVGITVKAEADLGAEQIEKDKLIDNHYYAIANKASLSKPAELNPSAAKQEEFKKKFGISWEEALDAGLVYNAVDACKKLGIGGAAMDAKWAKAKKDGVLIKFGGGFYAGKIPLEAASPAEWLSPVLLAVYALLGK